MFRLVSFFLGEKLCLKFCTVINKVIENRFLLLRRPAFLLKHSFSAWLCHGSHSKRTRSMYRHVWPWNSNRGKKYFYLYFFSRWKTLPKNLHSLKSIFLKKKSFFVKTWFFYRHCQRFLLMKHEARKQCFDLYLFQFSMTLKDSPKLSGKTVSLEKNHFMSLKVYWPFQAVLDKPHFL
jgi:hypothetical protein